MSDPIEIVEYESFFQGRFREINEEWIKRDFVMEEEDFKTLNDPDEYILRGGGRIFIALYCGFAVGTCAYLNFGDNVYEMIKMAVDEKYRGLKIGLTIGEVSLQRMKETGAKRIFLYSNTKGSAIAVNLYKKLGFLEIPLDNSEFQRADIKMSMEL